MKRTRFLKPAILFEAFLLALLWSQVLTIPVHGQTSGLVCIADSGTTVCPSSPPTFTGSVGSTLSLAINIQNSQAFNGFDIQVKADPTILNGTSVDTTGNVFQSMGGMLFVAGECINGHLIVGGSCSPQDGPGVVHFSAASNVVATGGHLYNINYQIVSSTSTSILFQTGCTGTSNGTACVTIVNASTIQPENLQEATFNAAPTPDFTISANPTQISIPRNTSGMSTISITALNGFSGFVFLTLNSSPGLLANISPHNVTGSGTATLTVSSDIAGSYTSTVTGTSGSLSHSITVSVTVTAPPPPDFIITASPSSQTTKTASSTNFIIYLNSVNGFTGTISLSATFSPVLHHGPTAQFSPASVTFSGNCCATSTLSVDAAHSTTLGTYTVTVTGTSGTLSHSVSVTVTVTR